MAAQGLQPRPRRYPVCITIDHDGACHAIDEWIRTQETNGEPTDGQEFFDFLEEVGDSFPDAIVHESDDEARDPPEGAEEPDPERPPVAAGPPDASLSDKDEALLYFVFMAWCQATWGDLDAASLARPTSS